tara:strand:- start:5004 stop:5510 length:507 start_codon:yes stop_codon:yes gene_type:complete
MVSLTELYNIKESQFETIHELKSNRDPARGNKGRSKEKDFYFIDEPADPETGSIKSKVVYKRSLSKMFEDLYAETQDFEKLIEEEKYKNDTVLYNITEELKEIVKIFNTHLRNNYPEEHKKLSSTNEQNTLAAAGSGASVSTGNSDGYMTPNAFAKKGKWKRKNEKYI